MRKKLFLSGVCICGTDLPGIFPDSLSDAAPKIRGNMAGWYNHSDILLAE